MAKIKRSQVQTFLNTTPASTDTWSLIGEGVVTGTINYNPEGTTETYFQEVGPTTSVERYSPHDPLKPP